MEGKRISAGFYFLFIYVLLLEIQLSRGEGWDLCIYSRRSSYQEGRVGIPLTGLTPPHFYACHKPEPGFLMP